MRLQSSGQRIRQQMREAARRSKGVFPMARRASCVGAILVGLIALHRGGVTGAILGYLASVFAGQAEEKVDLDIVPDPAPDPWWHRFTQQQAARAKRQPLTGRRPRLL